MKSTFLFIVTILLFSVSCKNSPVKEPKKLLDKEQMKELIYQIALLESLRMQNNDGTKNYPKANDFLKKNYKIDSLTFAQNVQYYASDGKEYKKMYDEVKDRLNQELVKASPSKKIIKTTQEAVVN